MGNEKCNGKWRSTGIDCSQPDPGDLTHSPRSKCHLWRQFRGLGLSIAPCFVSCLSLPPSLLIVWELIHATSLSTHPSHLLCPAIFGLWANLTGEKILRADRIQLFVYYHPAVVLTGNATSQPCGTALDLDAKPWFGSLGGLIGSQK